MLKAYIKQLGPGVFEVEIKQGYVWMFGYVDIDTCPQSRSMESDGSPSLGYMGDKDFKWPASFFLFFLFWGEEWINTGLEDG
jgi:hypothetical protein